MEIFKNTSWIMISQIITSIFGFVWVILIARYLGVSEFGILTFGISFASLMAIFMDLGISTYTTRDLSRDPELASKYIGNGIPLKIVLSLLSFFASLAILIIMGYDSLTIEVALIFTIQFIFFTMGHLFNGAFQAYGKLKYQAISIILNSCLLLIGTLFVIVTDLGIYSVAMVYLTSSLITLTYLYIKSNSEIVRASLQFDLAFWKKSVKNAIPFGLTGIFTSIYFLIDTVMLSFMKGSVAVGIYSSAYKIITVFTTLYMVYNFVIFPLMSSLYKNSADMLKISYEKSVKYLLMMVLPIAIGISYYAEPVVLLIYGSQFAHASYVLQILIWNVIFLFINGASTLLLNSSNKEVAVTKINFIACIFNFITNLILISYFSYIGASIGTVMTGILICAIMAYIIIKSEYQPDFALLKDIVKIIISNLILGIILYVASLPFIIAIPVAIITYLIAIALTKTLDSTDIGIIKEIIGKKDK